MKYRKKLPPDVDMRVYKEVCIQCGKVNFVKWPKVLPIPNMTDYWSKPSWLQCKFGQHYFYPEDTLEKI